VYVTGKLAICEVGLVHIHGQPCKQWTGFTNDVTDNRFSSDGGSTAALKDGLAACLTCISTLKLETRSRLTGQKQDPAQALIVFGPVPPLK
jgi:hypothetical protein